jgi:Flp pilus assembly protein TadD
VTTLREAFQLSEQALSDGNLPGAQSIFKQILQTVPDEPHAVNGLGVVAFRSGRLTEAEDHHRRAIALRPDNPTFHSNLYLVYYQQGRLAEAIACCRRALELDPNSSMLHGHLGVGLKADGQFEPAVASLRRALELNPNDVDTHYNLANALVALQRVEEAEREFRRAIELAPSDYEAHNNLGALLQMTGRFDEAMEAFDAALRCHPGSAEVIYNRALLRLLWGDYESAWADFESRFELRTARPPQFSEPRWHRQSLAERTVLLWSEQGLGDTLQMIRYAPLVKQRGATVLVECQPVLHSLLQNAPGIDRLVDAPAGDAKFDYQIPLLSLPGALDTTVETIPDDVPYLSAEPQLVERWRQELAQVDGFKVGIVWQGNPDYLLDAQRSVPLAEFAPLAECPAVRLFSLQKQYGSEQLAESGFDRSITDLAEKLHDFRDTAAVMMNLDLVITCDTAAAHLAGGLGVPVWVALPLAPDWRWLLERQDSPWYPTMRLFRQSRAGDWSEAFARIAKQLASLSSRHGLG